MADISYSDKLKDPRWQKKRLAILEKDHWACCYCGDNTSTLHVHHLEYHPSGNPWEGEDRHLVTLCEGCHKEEHERGEATEAELLQVIRLCKFSAEDLGTLMRGFRHLKNSGAHRSITGIVYHVLKHKDIQDETLKSIINKFKDDEQYKQ